MRQFQLQSEYRGVETGAILLASEKSEIYYPKMDKPTPEGVIPVGSVEFCESFLPCVPSPNYYPTFLKNFFLRKIWKSEGLPSETCFLKPADRHKRFDAYIFQQEHSSFLDLKAESSIGPFDCSEPIKFINEWRYYISNGEVLAAYWYLGDDEEADPPEIDVDWPKDFCGAVDFGRTSFGEVALVENNLPYGCGWYGGYSNAGEYKQWLEKGWSFMMKNYT